MENQLKATELRIGNTILINGHMCNLELPDLNLIANRNGKSTYSPIQLTEDILVKLGFEIEEIDDGITDADFGHNPLTKDYIITIKNVGDGWFYRNGHFKINYLHQLQNLYFSLCGDELTFKN